MKAGSTIIKHCDCKSEYQDAIYGKNMRVHNVGQEKDGRQLTTCTVCVPPRSMARLESHGREHNKKIHGQLLGQYNDSHNVRTILYRYILPVALVVLCNQACEEAIIHASIQG